MSRHGSREEVNTIVRDELRLNRIKTPFFPDIRLFSYRCINCSCLLYVCIMCVYVDLNTVPIFIHLVQVPDNHFTRNKKDKHHSTHPSVQT